MKDDPGLISHVRGYFEGGGQTPQSMIEKMNLDEDFQMDMQEAVKDPESDSGKVFNATIDGLVQQRLGAALKQRNLQDSRASQETQFRKDHEMSDEEYTEFKDFAKKKRLGLEDLYYLKNREQRDENIVKDVSKKTIEKIRKTQNRPTSLANVGSEKSQEKSPTDKVMDVLVGIDQQGDIMGLGN